MADKIHIINFNPTAIECVDFYVRKNTVFLDKPSFEFMQYKKGYKQDLTFHVDLAKMVSIDTDGKITV